jgi:ribonuclease P protein component
MQHFLPIYKLHQADEFSSVFKLRKLRFSRLFKLHYKPNGLNYSRLGMIIGRKINKRSSRRNYCKRVVREYFRTHQADWAAYDVIVRVQSAFTRQQYMQAIAELDQITCALKSNYIVAPHSHLINP